MYFCDKLKICCLLYLIICKFYVMFLMLCIRYEKVSLKFFVKFDFLCIK